MLRDVRGKWGKGLAVALAVSGLLLFAGCGNKQAQQKAPAAVAVKTMQVIKRDTAGSEADGKCFRQDYQ